MKVSKRKEGIPERIRLPGSPKLPVRFSIRETSEIPLLREQCRSLLADLAGGNPGLLFVGFNEALNNAIFHSGAQGTPVNIKFNTITDRILVIRVKNQGQVFPGNEILSRIQNPDKNPFEAVLDQESCRGIPIIKSIFSKVLYNRDGTEIMMIKFLSN